MKNSRFVKISCILITLLLALECQAVLTELGPVADTYMRSLYYPTYNYGSDVDLYVARNLYNGENKASLVKFDMGSLSGVLSDDVTSATLKLRLVADVYTYPTSYVPWLVEAHRVMPGRDWIESEATANEYKSGSAWTQQCGLGLGTDISSAHYGQARADNLLAGELLELDITNLVKEWLSGTTNNGVSLKFATSGPQPSNVNIGLGSSDHTDANYHPVLAVDYIPEPATIGLLLTGLTILSAKRKRR